MPPEADARAWRAALLIIGAAALVRLVFATLVPLVPDETYYWDWSRRLAGGYFDHPPMIAVLVRGGTAMGDLLGMRPSSFLIRLLPIVAGAFASLATIAIARRLGDARAARTAAVVFSLMPLAATGLVLATPDAPLLAASAGGLYAVVRAFDSPPRSSASLLWWCAAGVALGLAFASKYTSILLPVAITAAMLLRPSLRARLREPGPYVACLVATLVFLPVLRWNAAHDWISFRFQIQHGLGTPKGSAIKRELDLLGGQLGLVSPIVFVMMAHAVWRAARRPRTDAEFALAIVATLSWLFFVYSALRRSVEPNWPAPSYIPGVVLLAVTAASAARDRWMQRGVALAGVLVAAVYLLVLVPLIPARKDPIARGAGWGEVAARVAEARQRVGGRAFVGADRYQDVAELAYQLPDHPLALCMCLGGRHNQYELWPTFPAVAHPGDALVLAVDDTPDNVMHGTVARLDPYFGRVIRGAIAAQRRGMDTVSVRRIWVLEGYRGGWPARSDP